MAPLLSFHQLDMLKGLTQEFVDSCCVTTIYYDISCNKMQNQLRPVAEHVTAELQNEVMRDASH